MSIVYCKTCIMMWWICITNFNQLQNLHVEIFNSHVKFAIFSSYLNDWILPEKIQQTTINMMVSLIYILLSQRQKNEATL